MKNRFLTLGLVFLFVFTSLIPMSIGRNTKISNSKLPTQNYNRYLYPEFYNCYNTYERTNYERFTYNSKIDSTDLKKVDFENTLLPLDSPMNSPWPMQSHDIRHTGRSNYSTVDTYNEIWKCETSGWADSSPAIDKNGTIYIGSDKLNAVNPNGTLKWSYYLGDSIENCCPAIDENNIIYIGTKSNLCALYPNGTLKWKYSANGEVIPSPVIGNNGVIYYAAGGGYQPEGHVTARYQNGTLKWNFPTNDVMYSSPAIGLDGTIYCGSFDGNVYALYPNNGTLKWKYNTGSWVHGSPTIANDGTVYIGSDNGYFYAFYPDNGTVKWAIKIGEIYGSPALDKDGTIYTGVWENSFYAIYPNSTIKWRFNTGAHVWGSSPALSDDSTLYFGTCDLDMTGGIEIIALYTNDTVKWRQGLDTVFSSPAIGSDGTVYIGSCSEPGKGYLNAFGIGSLEADTHGPYYGLMDYSLQFTGSTLGGYSPITNWHWDFGDNTYSNEQNPSHTYFNPGNYTVSLTVKDSSGNSSTNTTWAWIQTTNTPPNKPTINGPTKGNIGTSYAYKISSSDPDKSIIWYYIDWGDNTNTGWLGPYDSGTEITQSHSWNNKGSYTIQTKAKDPYNANSEWAILKVTIPRTKASMNNLFLNLAERFPILKEVFSWLIKE